ncbi:GspH/FimT family pseudopilin [Shewanella gelidii]|uniref:Type II secretion system protein H n=1 Tax=Shewanella gelidii TaxID=1642821 RepID=A0A917JIH0_9GAMM|nr:GspH/FimT family pseudopilin [Shewanella gelidii]MCL1096612.1 GspH/FimT family pseudopilin [Shewanella gelidii]GGI68869.1 type IV minor pilin protein FimT [Shewanella gelidii]
MCLTKGFTLTESVVAISIAGILITVGSPTFTDIYEHTRADSHIRVLQQSIVYARNQAISYGARVTICPLENGLCHKNWQQGYSIFIDRDIANSFGDKDVLLYKSKPFNKKDWVQYNRNAIRFQPEGFASGTNGTLKFCPGAKNSPYSRAIVVNQSGRVRYSKKKSIVCI